MADKFIRAVVRNPRRRLFAAIVSGLMLGLSYPTWDLLFLLPFSFLPVYWAFCRAETVVESFRIGFCFGAVFYLVHAYWFYSYSPLVLPVVVAWLGLYLGFWGAVVKYFRGSVFYGVAAWILIEWLLEFGLAGQGYVAFPWSRIATALAAWPVLIQPLAWAGEYLLGAFWLLLALSWARWLLDGERLVLALITTLALLLLVLSGYYRISAEPPLTDREVLIVQPNVSSAAQHRQPQQLQRQRLVEATEKKARAGDLVIWPETVFARPPFRFESGEPVWPTDLYRRQIEKLVSTGFDLFLGVTFYDPVPGKLNFLNGALFVNRSGRITGYYTKRYPVPGGEHVPLMGRWEWLKKLARSAGTLGYRGGRRGGLIGLSTEGGSREIGVQICYDVAFGSYVRRQVREGADLLITIANDSWSRSRASHRQHAYRARIRTVETGRPVLRAGNTGISAIIGPRGRYLNRQPAYSRGTIRGRIPKSLDVPLYTRTGGWLTGAGFVLLLFLGWFFDSIKPEQKGDLQC